MRRAFDRLAKAAQARLESGLNVVLRGRRNRAKDRSYALAELSLVCSEEVR